MEREGRRKEQRTVSQGGSQNRNGRQRGERRHEETECDAEAVFERRRDKVQSAEEGNIKVEGRGWRKEQILFTWQMR